MEELIWFVFAPLLELLGYAITEDDRPAARGITIGCCIFVVFALVAAGIFLYR